METSLRRPVSIYNGRRQGARACPICHGLFPAVRLWPPWPPPLVTGAPLLLPASRPAPKMLDRAMRWVQLALVENGPETAIEPAVDFSHSPG